MLSKILKKHLREIKIMDKSDKNMSAIIKPKMNDLINIKVIQKDFNGEKDLDFSPSPNLAMANCLNCDLCDYYDLCDYLSRVINLIKTGFV